MSSVGAVSGVLLFGWNTDRHGRRLVFYGTLIIYLVGVLLSWKLQVEDRRS